MIIALPKKGNIGLRNKAINLSRTSGISMWILYLPNYNMEYQWYGTFINTNNKCDCWQ